MPASSHAHSCAHVHQNHASNNFDLDLDLDLESDLWCLSHTWHTPTSTTAFYYYIFPDSGLPSPSAATSTRLRQSCNCSLHHRNLGRRAPHTSRAAFSITIERRRSNLTLSLGRTFSPARSVVIRLKLSKELPRPRTRRFIQTLFYSRPATAIPAHTCGAKTQTQTHTTSPFLSHPGDRNSCSSLRCH